MKDIFETYQEADHPPYQEWILDEAHGDLQLADLIERREIMFDEVSTIGGMRGLEPEEQEQAQAYLNSIYIEINERKRELGIDLPEEQ